ncbi:MAG: hypothetical protein WCA81_18345 [Rhizomicrobium sp.]|jgi:hypothetical protein
MLPPRFRQIAACRVRPLSLCYGRIRPDIGRCDPFGFPPSTYFGVVTQLSLLEDIIMSEPIDQFCENLRIKLTNIDSGLAGLKAKIDGKSQQIEQAVRLHLDDVRWRIKQDAKKVSAAQAEVKDWAESQKVVTEDKIAEWKAKRDLGKLQGHAVKAERYAEAAIDLAMAAVDEVEKAAIEAWLARHDADSAPTKKTAPNMAIHR